MYMNRLSSCSTWRAYYVIYWVNTSLNLCGGFFPCVQVHMQPPWKVKTKQKGNSNMCHSIKYVTKQLLGACSFTFFRRQSHVDLSCGCTHASNGMVSFYFCASASNNKQYQPSIGHIKGGGGTGDHSGSVLVGDDTSTKLFLRFWCPTSVPNRYSYSNRIHCSP